MVGDKLTFLYTQASTALLNPKLRVLGPLSYQEYVELSRSIVPNPLSFTQSLSIIWPQVVSIIAAMFLVFLLSYIIFMKKEIRVS